MRTADGVAGQLVTYAGMTGYGWQLKDRSAMIYLKWEVIPKVNY